MNANPRFIQVFELRGFLGGGGGGDRIFYFK